MAFPNIRRANSLTGGVYDPRLEEDYAGGQDGSRPMFTAPANTPMQASWEGLPQEHLDLLEAWVRGAGRVGTFEYAHPNTGQILTCRLSGDQPLKWSTAKGKPGYSATLTMKRVS